MYPRGPAGQGEQSWQSTPPCVHRGSLEHLQQEQQLLKRGSWSGPIGSVSTYEKLFVSGTGLKLIVSCLSYPGNIITDHE